MKHRHSYKPAELKQPTPQKGKPVRFKLVRFYKKGKRYPVKPFYTIRWFGGKVQKGWSEYGVKFKDLVQSSAYSYWAHDEGLARFKDLNYLKRAWKEHSDKRKEGREFLQKFKKQTQAVREGLKQAQAERDSFKRTAGKPIVSIKRSVPGVGLIINWSQPSNWKPHGYYIRFKSTGKKGWTGFGSLVRLQKSCFKGGAVIMNNTLKISGPAPWHIAVFADKKGVGEKQSNLITWKG